MWPSRFPIPIFAQGSISRPCCSIRSIQSCSALLDPLLAFVRAWRRERRCCWVCMWSRKSEVCSDWVDSIPGWCDRRMMWTIFARRWETPCWSNYQERMWNVVKDVVDWSTTYYESWILICFLWNLWNLNLKLFIILFVCIYCWPCFVILSLLSMERKAKPYSTEEDLQIASCMLNYFSELGLSSEDNTTCSERQEKYEVLFIWVMCCRNLSSKYIPILTQTKLRKIKEVITRFVFDTMYSSQSYVYFMLRNF